MCTHRAAVRSLALMLAVLAGVWCVGGLAPAARGQCQNRWLPGPQFPVQEPGNDNISFCSCMWDPDGTGYQQPRLIVGGLFTTMGGQPANNIAMWDGTHWTALGQGLNDFVVAVASFNGELYAGGLFTASGSNTCTRLAKYNATTHAWTQVGSGFNDIVRALEVHQNDLFAGGDFTASGATPIGHVSRLVGGTWTQLAGGGLPGQVTSLHSLGLSLYVGGTFSSAGTIGLTVHNLASWSSTSQWQDCLGGTNGPVQSLGENGGNLVVGGGFSAVHGGTIPCNDVGVFVPGTPGIWISGTGFPFSGGVPYAVLGNQASPTSLYATTNLAGGASSICYRYNGTSWLPVGTGIPSGQNGDMLVNYDNEVLLGGSFATGGVGGQTLHNLAVLHRNNWSPLRARINGTIRTFASFGSTILAGGEMEQSLADYSHLSGIVTWSPTTNTIGSYGTVRGTVNALFFSSNGITLPTLYAAGSFPSAGNTGQTFNNIGAWSGLIGTGGVDANWAPVGAGFNGPVNALAGFGTTGVGINRVPVLHAGGSFTLSGATGCRNVAKLVSGAWQPLGTGVASSSGTERVNAFTNFGGQLIAGGVFDTAGGVTANSIAAWNGTAWSALGSGVQSAGAKGTVDTAVVFNSALIAGGRFDTAGGVSTRNVASWNGTSWQSMGAGIAAAGEEATALAVYDAQLFVATNNIAGGAGNISRVYRWTGAAWAQVGTGGDDGIYALASFDNALQAGGAFHSISGADAIRWARMSCFCVGDYNASGAADVQDIFDFLSAWFAGDLNSDVNGDGALTVQDIFDFLAAWFTPCT